MASKCKEFYSKDLAFSFLKKHPGATLSWERLGPLVDARGRPYAKPTSSTKPYTGPVKYTVCLKKGRR